MWIFFLCCKQTLLNMSFFKTRNSLISEILCSWLRSIYHETIHLSLTKPGEKKFITSSHFFPVPDEARKSQHSLAVRPVNANIGCQRHCPRSDSSISNQRLTPAKSFILSCNFSFPQNSYPKHWSWVSDDFILSHY